MCKVSGAPWTNQAIAFVNPNGDIVIVDRCQGAGTIAFKAGTDVAVFNYTDGLHTFIIRSGSATISNGAAERMVRSSANASNRVFNFVGNRFVLPPALAAAIKVVDLYDINGELLGRAAVGPGGVITIDRGLRLGRQTIVAAVKQ
jgi:hypothetical protein